MTQKELFNIPGHQTRCKQLDTISSLRQAKIEKDEMPACHWQGCEGGGRLITLDGGSSNWNNCLEANLKVDKKKKTL